MTVFVDTSAWFAAVNLKDRHHERASTLVAAEDRLITSTFVLVETWLLLQSKIAFAVAELDSRDRVRRDHPPLEEAHVQLVTAREKAIHGQLRRVRAFA